MGRYFIAELYINKVLKENNFANSIPLSPLVKKDKRIQKFLESENLRQSKMIYDSKSNVIYISNPHKWAIQDKNIILATHTGNVNVDLFVAKIKFHAQALVDTKAYFDRWYKATC